MAEETNNLPKGEVNPVVASETRSRRTFAIISHPDAGKTTLTEKLLLYSGMIRTAGMVRGRKGSKAASSDWMSMEQERGISITASAMQFAYKDTVINVLDTPGHQDFSEDTYRTLTAADCAVMVIDAAKGVETQTRKLFSVCRMRGVPILTFINKMDLPGREPLELMEEVEQTLGIKSSPLNWPIGNGSEFVGVVDLMSEQVLLFSKVSVGGAERAAVKELKLDEFLKIGNKELGVKQSLLDKLVEDLELLKIAGNQFSADVFLSGEITPVFFGSALTNFGVETFFDHFVDLAPSPRPVTAVKDDGQETIIDPETFPFSGFVFKIQANMNPKHRDCMAFIRVCSGQFERENLVYHHRLGKELRLSRSHAMLARGRNILDSAFPGDIVGVTSTGLFQIGDTVSNTRGGFSFKRMPQFPPEVVGQIRPLDVSKRKAFDKGIEQLGQEGTVQLLFSRENPNAEPYVAAVGRLQFEVLQYRMQDEYGVQTKLDLLPQQFSAWLVGDPATFKKPSTSLMAQDSKGRVVVLFTNQWEKRYSLEQNPGHSFKEFSD